MIYAARLLNKEDIVFKIINKLNKNNLIDSLYKLYMYEVYIRTGTFYQSNIIINDITKSNIKKLIKRGYRLFKNSIRIGGKCYKEIQINNIKIGLKGDWDYLLSRRKNLWLCDLKTNYKPHNIKTYFIQQYLYYLCDDSLKDVKVLSLYFIRTNQLYYIKVKDININKLLKEYKGNN